MTPLGAQIVAVAQAYHNRQCVETLPNRGPCVDELHKLFNGKVSPDPWCAISAWVWVDLAAQQLGVKNVLPKTAGARDMLNKSERVAGLRVDTAPAPGATFYRKSKAPGATGHIGIVKTVTSWGILTIEGNHNDRVLEYHYTNAELANSANMFRFIHTESMPGAPKAMTAPTSAAFSSILTISLLATAAWWAWDNWK